MVDELTIAELMGLLHEQFSYEAICKLSPEQMAHYQELLNRFQQVNSSPSVAKEKGDTLESLVAYLIKISGNIFTVVQNVKTNSNEIDEVIELNTTGQALCQNGLISNRYKTFLGECKNYNKAVSVTYIGKFYSLLQTTQIQTGILFSYHGISGEGWNDGSGLVKKIYLQRECHPNRVTILDFNISDFKLIAEGHNFFEIIDAKLHALQFDTSIDPFISAHPAESLF